VARVKRYLVHNRGTISPTERAEASVGYRLSWRLMDLPHLPVYALRCFHDISLSLLHNLSSKILLPHV